MITLNQSRIKLYRRCPQAYYYQEIEHLEKKKKSPALEKGSLMHNLGELFFNNGDWKRLLGAYRERFETLMEEEREYYGDIPSEADRMFNGYLNRWYPGGKVTEKVLAVELDFSDKPVELAPGVFLKGTIDRIVKIMDGPHKGKIALTEMKNMKKIPSEEERFYDTQTCLYVPAARSRGFKIDLVMWDYVRTKPPTVPEVLKKGGISKNKKVDTDHETYLRVITENGYDPNDYREELERAKNNLFFDRKFMPISERLIEQVINDFVITAKQIERLAHYPVRVLNKMICKQCSFIPLCRAEMMGLDVDFIRKTEYKERVEKRGGLLLDEELEEDEEDDI